jgi:hypothetical protein
MRALTTRRRRVVLALVAPSLRIELEGDWRRFSCVLL